MDTFTDILRDAYTDEAVQKINTTLSDQLSTDFKPPNLKAKHYQLYVTYPNAFCEENTCGLPQLTNQLERIKKLGFSAVHILPPFQSPMIDNGFDVSDYYKVREDLGGNDAFDVLLQKAKSIDMHVFIDFVLNHVSDQHEWFQNALAGDAYYQDFFASMEDRPVYVQTFEKDGAQYARYEINNTIHDIRIIFPDQVGDIPHWVEHNERWYYHTFYPEQIDLNWHNPNVFIEMASILVYWANKGCSFRLDAVPYVGKKWIDGMQIDTPTTHTVIRALHTLLKHVNPESSFLTEVTGEMSAIIQYSGTPTAHEADFTYHFELTESIWESLILQDTDRLWQLLQRFPDLPNWTQWVTFLRNHDELTLRHSSPSVKTQLLQILEPRGKVFREGSAVAGRTASFLANDTKHIALAHALLASLPGNPAVMYGDELGKLNDEAYMYEQVKIKEQQGVHAKPDTRDINRGQINTLDLDKQESFDLQNIIQKIFTARLQYSDLATTIPDRLQPNDKSVFAARYALTAGDLYMYLNLGKEPISIHSDTKDTVLTIHDVTVEQGSITLGSYSGVWLRD